MGNIYDKKVYNKATFTFNFYGLGLPREIFDYIIKEVPDINCNNNTGPCSANVTCDTLGAGLPPITYKL